MKAMLKTTFAYMFFVLVNAAPQIREKRQFNLGDPQIGQQNRPSWQQLSTTQQNPQFGQQFGNINPQFGNQNIQFGQNSQPTPLNNQNPFFNQWGQGSQNQNPSLFSGFGSTNPSSSNSAVGNGFSNGANRGSTQPPRTSRIPSNGLNLFGQNGVVTGAQNSPISRDTTSIFTSTTTQTPRTTPSQIYLRCLSSCPSTMEYNPVCGNDGLNYHNMQRLTCANECGKTVTMVRRGTCSAL